MEKRKSFLPKSPRPLTTEEKAELERSDKRNSSRRKEADRHDAQTIEEEWEALDKQEHGNTKE